MKQDEIIEAAIQGHASTRDAIRWAIDVAQHVEQVCLCKTVCLQTGMYLCKGLPSPLAAQPPQPKQEPEVDLQTRWPMKNWKENKATPPRRTWVDLTDEEIQAVAKQARSKDHAVTLTNKFLRDKNT